MKWHERVLYVLVAVGVLAVLVFVILGAVEQFRKAHQSPEPRPIRSGLMASPVSTDLVATRDSKGVHFVLVTKMKCTYLSCNPMRGFGFVRKSIGTVSSIPPGGMVTIPVDGKKLGPLRMGQSLYLKKLKPGLVELPSVRVTFLQGRTYSTIEYYMVSIQGRVY